MPAPLTTTAFSRITALASQAPVHKAFAWLHTNPKTIMDWQTELVAIPAPPFGEEARSAWMAARFTEAGLSAVETDAVGNVLAMIPAQALPPDSTGPVILLSAHLDTVFPAETPLQPVFEDGRLQAPSACDNAAGVVGMLAIVRALLHGGIALPAPLVVMGNVGEEGEGDLRGVRHFYKHNALAGRVAAHIVLDGAGTDTIVSQALGSRRFLVTVTGPGGHSFSDAGTPNPIAALAKAIATLAEVPLPEEPRTTLNVGTLHGGISVNAIPQKAQAAIDFRSSAAEPLIALEVALHRAVEDAVEQCNKKGNSTGENDARRLAYKIEKIGDRPTGQLAEDSELLAALRATDRHLGLRADLRLGSTDANLPLSLGIPAFSIGAGGVGGGAHTLQEWFSDKNREIALKRILLFTLAMLEWAAGQ
jgi:acetylornithine deacetylase/succinyl-diaminopimelate desuccinylase-like protein